MAGRAHRNQLREESKAPGPPPNGYTCEGFPERYEYGTEGRGVKTAQEPKSGHGDGVRVHPHTSGKIPLDPDGDQDEY